jgi:hypothetical protein
MSRAEIGGFNRDLLKFPAGAGLAVDRNFIETLFSVTLMCELREERGGLRTDFGPT